MLDPSPKTTYLKDYEPPAFLIASVDLDIDLQEDVAQVRAKLALRRNPQSRHPEAPLVLDGDELELQAVALDGQPLAPSQYELARDRLTIRDVPSSFVLETVSRIRPKQNTKLMGLYFSRTGYFTQCEPEGFRRITWFVDRPDVMACYTTTIHADKEQFPFLLSNGNPIERGDHTPTDATPRDTARPRHWVRWEDPFPKPSYLFAMVAGKLDRLEDRFVTQSGREVALSIFVEPGKIDQCGFAMQALKKAMRWDEQVFGLELDLDHYMIVAVADFNMGAMENKGLNIFNTKYVLARPDIATDSDFMFLDRVVAHEYFHNWTGNRVTCRDWFQLSLKEGLTVFRDQEYGADMYSRAVHRIQEVRALRAAQFPEDAGPMAHPVRPQSYMEISNFYTATVYEKGAEVVRMIHTLIGAGRFRQGLDLYFQRHDGCAVTTDEFVQAMQDASGVDLAQFRRWYDQAGTPVLETSGEYDPDTRTYTLSVEQSCPPTPGQSEKQPFHVPFAIGLMGPDGAELPVQMEGESRAGATTRVLSVKQQREVYRFANVAQPPVPSLLRNFSAPVVVRHTYSEAELSHLATHDTDAFNRWDAAQRLALSRLLVAVGDVQRGNAPDAPVALAATFRKVLADAPSDPAFAAEMLALPAEGYVGEQMAVVDPDAIHAVRVTLRRQLAQTLKDDLLGIYRTFSGSVPYRADPRAAGERGLKNACLSYLMELDDAAIRGLCLDQFGSATNMTDAMAAVTAFANASCPERADVLARFYAKWKDEPLVVDKWLTVQATSRLPGTLTEVKSLTAHPAFDLRNPNKVYALLRAFSGNQVRFNAADGGGYTFMADQVLALDPVNPQVAARLARAFDRWRKYDAGRQERARTALERVRDTPALSKDTTEVVSKALA